MTINKKYHHFLPFVVFLAGMLPILFNLGTMGLLESTESLIASIARNMVDTNDLSTPVYNGVKHFEYAPGVYWITALGIKIFGSSELGARFFLSVAAGFTALCIFFIAKLFFGIQCAVISSLLLCTSALFQISFRTISPAAYCTAFESLLCLVFFHYLNKPSLLFRHTFWLILSIGFMFFGFPVLLSVIALTIVAYFTGQKEQIKKLYFFGPGLICFAVFGLGWYLIQVIINNGLLSYYLYRLPYNNFFVNYKGAPFYLYIFLPLVAVFPWTSIWLQEIKNKIKDFKEDPVVTYLVSWAFFPFIIRLLMVSREYSHFMSSLPPLLLLTAPAFQALYFKKDDNTEASIKTVQQRRKHNLVLVIVVAIIGMVSSIYGGINYEITNVISKNLTFIGIFWLFSSLIMLAFMIKKLNKSVIVPAAMLIPSLILFSVPAIQGDEPTSKDTYLSSKFILLNRIGRMPGSDFIFCAEPLYGTYFYTGRNFKLAMDSKNFEFLTKEGKSLILSDEKSFKLSLTPESFLVMPAYARKEVEKILNKNLNLSAEESDWRVFTQGEKLNNGIQDNSRE